jgi:hypothetical protein
MYDIQILRFWISSIVLSLLKTPSCFYWKHNVSATGFCLRLQEEPTQLGRIDRASPYLRTPAQKQNLEIRFKERKYNLTQEVLGKSKLAQHA